MLLTIAGSVLGYEARLEITGLPTMADVTQAENDLETGQRSLPDVIRDGLHRAPSWLRSAGLRRTVGVGTVIGDPRGELGRPVAPRRGWRNPRP